MSETDMSPEDGLIARLVARYLPHEPIPDDVDGRIREQVLAAVRLMPIINALNELPNGPTSPVNPGEDMQSPFEN